MDRKSFLGSFALGAATAAALSPAESSSNQLAGGKTAALGSGLVIPEGATLGVRRLGSDKNFTVFRAGIEPAYRVSPGEVVLVETQHGLPGLVTRDGTFRKAGPGDKVNPMTGPIRVEGIEPGDALAIDLLEIRVGDWGYAGGRIFELRDGYAIFDESLRLPLSPMLGGIGVVPAEGEMDTKTPKETGGNMDCKEVRAGSTVVFTAQVDGGLVGMGDAHALQGDGEVRGQGIECDTETLVRFRKLPRPLSRRPVILRREFVATVGADEDMNAAAWQATDDMIELVVKATGRDKETAYALVNLVGDLRINQIVDPAKGARMEVPAWVFGI
ncbi:MAG: acetamidase/formamidase family protein [Candidatus Glassbacteria bacterium]|nr:acetamidase/formamidase family protein [Candidatus Glassbacteria bacterium]